MLCSTRGHEERYASTSPGGQMPFCSPWCAAQPNQWSTWMKGLVEMQNSPAAHWNALMWMCTPQIPSCCCSSCQHWCLEFRPQNTVTKLSQTPTERIPLLALGGAYVLYREQQLVSVRSMSGFWLRLRVDQQSYKWLNSEFRKLASSTASFSHGRNVCPSWMRM